MMKDQDEQGTSPGATPEATAESVAMGKVISIDQARIKGHLDTMVRETVEETLNGPLEAEANALCGAKRYERNDERNDERRDTRAGSYKRGLHTKAGDVELKVPKLRKLPFETAIIERYKRREASMEEALTGKVSRKTSQAPVLMYRSKSIKAGRVVILGLKDCLKTRQGSRWDQQGLRTRVG